MHALHERPLLRHSRDFPQQLPGPAQPAFVGVEPQQAVSPCPESYFRFLCTITFNESTLGISRISVMAG
jgi:hypothetical protein